MLRDITSSLDEASTESMEQTMKEWQQRKRGTPAYDTGGSSTGNDGNVTLPLSQGEWDEPLGLPLCVVCHGVRIFIYTLDMLCGDCTCKADRMEIQADKINTLEVEHGWKEEEFDFVLQFLRTILMKRKTTKSLTFSVANDDIQMVHP